jgi:hypothetical protein
MKRIRFFGPLLATFALMSACGTMEPVAQYPDDVYSTASQRSLKNRKVAAVDTEHTAASDDYYNADEAKRNTGSAYYDQAYNDPYYYNYGRFSFGTGLAFRHGWFMAPTGQMMGWGYGTGVYSGWSGYGLSTAYGVRPWGLLNSPWGWYDPWYGWSSFGGYNGYGNYGYGSSWGGYGGYGSYYGPYGACYTCYTPVVIGGSTEMLVRHRTRLGQSGQATGTDFRPRMSYRDPISLTPNLDRPTRTGSDTGRTPGRANTERPLVSAPAWGRGSQPGAGERPPSGRTLAPMMPGRSDSGSDRMGGFPARSSGGGFPSRSGGGGMPSSPGGGGSAPMHRSR